ncbi:MAG: hypothetical protein D6729_04475 [Deltaproteobacteria bacterium]|nr:MAG: hypothetical protein D6729_04475 [Deltaproteobacteria bacterium]
MAVRRFFERSIQEEDAQAIVLGALSMFVLALMLIMSLNVTQAVHEKIRLQQSSDALAYSMAVQEARALNYFAYSNRAMAATYAALTSVHAYYASMIVTGDMLAAARINFFIIAGIEFALCCACTWCSCFSHCIHGIQAIRIAFKFGREKRKYERRIKSMEQKFNRLVQALDFMVDNIHAAQLEMWGQTVAALMSSRSKFDEIWKQNAPQASNLDSAIAMLNVNEFNCALEGIVAPCVGGSREARRPNRGKVMTVSSNATRPRWATTRKPGSPFPIHLGPRFLADLMNRIQGNGVSLPLNHKGTAKIVDRKSRSTLESSRKGEEGRVVGADEHGILFSYWKHGVGVFPYSAEIYSDKNGGRHKPRGGHTGQHKKFEGVQAKNRCVLKGNCFIKFRAHPDRDDDFNQPKVYAYLQQDLSLTRKGDRPGGWNPNDTGTINLTHGAQGTGSLTFRPGMGRALSKAMVYYHRLGEWREPPNLFNPYWRAKLHPMKRGEAARALALARETEAIGFTALPFFPVN